jgi:hypothetical protein
MNAVNLLCGDETPRVDIKGMTEKRSIYPDSLRVIIHMESEIEGSVWRAANTSMPARDDVNEPGVSAHVRIGIKREAFLPVLKHIACNEFFLFRIAWDDAPPISLSLINVPFSPSISCRKILYCNGPDGELAGSHWNPPFRACIVDTAGPVRRASG